MQETADAEVDSDDGDDSVERQPSAGNKSRKPAGKSHPAARTQPEATRARGW